MKCRKGKDETMKIAWVHKLLGKYSKKFYGILAGILTAAVAGSGVGYHVIAASGTADQTEEDTQIDETDEDGSFSGSGTTQVKTESQLPDFSVNAVTMTVEKSTWKREALCGGRRLIQDRRREHGGCKSVLRGCHFGCGNGTATRTDQF